MAEIARLAWYRQGLISVTNGDTKVTGIGTKFLTAGINAGATLRLDARGDYALEVDRVVSDTEIQLVKPYVGQSANNQTYSIDCNHHSTLPSDLSLRLAKAMGNWEARYDLDMQTITGKSAYELAVENGFVGTKAQWLESLKATGELVALKNLVDPLLVHNAGAHNALCPCRNLGIFSDAQSAAIRAGTFGGTYGGVYADIYPGDYWVFSNIPYTFYWPTSDTTAQAGKTYYADATGTALETQPETGADISGAEYFEKLNNTYSGTMRAADLDYCHSAGDQGYGLTAHHVVVVPDLIMFNTSMNATDTTEGGYFRSKMRTVYLRRAEAIFKACFGENHVLKYRDILVNAVANGRSTGAVWCDNVVELMDERMVYGSLIFDSSSPDGSGGTAMWQLFNRFSVSCKQLNLFRHRPNLISNRQWYWLRNVVSAACFAYVDGNGNCYCYGASHSGGGVRPAALIY